MGALLSEMSRGQLRREYIRCMSDCRYYQAEAILDEIEKREENGEIILEVEG